MQQKRLRLHLVTTDTELPKEIPQVGVLTLKPETRSAVIALSRQDRKRLMTILTQLRDSMHNDQQRAAQLRSELQHILAGVRENQSRTATETPNR